MKYVCDRVAALLWTGQLNWTTATIYVGLTDVNPGQDLPVTLASAALTNKSVTDEGIFADDVNILLPTNSSTMATGLVIYTGTLLLMYDDEVVGFPLLLDGTVKTITLSRPLLSLFNADS